MSSNLPNYLSELPIYQKAMEICTLSRNISTYLNYDLCTLDEYGNEDPNIYFSGDIVQQSSSLSSEVINTALENTRDEKYKRMLSLKRLTRHLYNNCTRLENANSNGKEYLPLLKVELKRFSRLHRSWMLTL